MARSPAPIGGVHPSAASGARSSSPCSPAEPGHRRRGLPSAAVVERVPVQPDAAALPDVPDRSARAGRVAGRVDGGARQPGPLDFLDHGDEQWALGRLRFGLALALGSLVLREHVPLVTLTVPAGVGKTRLALQAAAEADRFADAVRVRRSCPDP